MGAVVTAMVYRIDDNIRRELREQKLSAVRAYLACVMLEPKTLDEHVPSLDALDERHRRVLEAALAIRAREEALDTVTLRAELIARHGKVDDEFLLNLTGTAPSTFNARRYVEIITDDHRTKLVRDAVTKRSDALKAGDPGAPAALSADLEAILARELDEGPLGGGGWVSDFGEDAIGATPAPRRWLLKVMIDNGRDLPWLARGKAGMLSSAGGVGKTFLAIQLALSVATGRRWLGCLNVQEPGCVALVVAEEDRDEVMRRLHYASNDLRLTREERDLAAKRIWVQPRAGRRSAFLETDPDRNLRETEFLRAMRRYMRGSGREWALVIVDPVARIAPPEAEKDNQIATSTVEAIESLAQMPGSPTVLALHHTNKVARAGSRLDASSSRGVTAFTDGFRWSAQLGPAFPHRKGRTKPKPVPNFWTLGVGKSNYNAARGLILTRDLTMNGVLRLATPEEHDEHDFDLSGDA